MPSLEIWVPTNRTDEYGRYTHMDGWNEILSAFATSRNVGSRLMRDNVRHVATWTSIAMRRYAWQVVTKRSAVPCNVTLTFVERDHRRDVGNIHGGAKYALDALTKRHKFGAGAIYDDSQRWLPTVEYRIECVGEQFVEPGLKIEVNTLEES